MESKLPGNTPAEEGYVLTSQEAWSHVCLRVRPRGRPVEVLHVYNNFLYNNSLTNKWTVSFDDEISQGS